MRWRPTQLGDTRARTIFCWFPLHIGSTAYWFERITVEEVYEHGRHHYRWSIRRVLS